jgi:hypothetical protein
MRREAYFEKSIETFFRRLFLEAFLLFWAKGTRLFGLLNLVEYSLEPNCRAQSGYSVEH